MACSWKCFGEGGAVGVQQRRLTKLGPGWVCVSARREARGHRGELATPWEGATTSYKHQIQDSFRLAADAVPSCLSWNCLTLPWLRAVLCYISCDDRNSALRESQNPRP